MNHEDALREINRVIDTRAAELYLRWPGDMVLADYELLSNAITLNKLTLDMCNTESNTLPLVAKLINLIELRLTGSHFSANLGALHPLRNIQVFDLSDNIFLDDNDIAELLGFKLWHKLTRSAPQIFPELREFNLERTGMHDSVCLLLKRVRTLRSVNLVRTDVGDGGIAHLCQLPLEGIGVGDEVTNAALEFFPQTLKSVTFESRRLTTAGLAPFFKNHQSLEKVRLIMHDRGEIMPWIGLLNRLNDLEIIGDMSTSSLRFLGELDNVEHLFVSGNSHSHEWIPVLEACQRLSKLSIAGLEINDAAIPLLGQLKQVKEYTLNATEVSDRGIEELREYRPDAKVHSINMRIGRSSYNAF